MISNQNRMLYDCTAVCLQSILNHNKMKVTYHATILQLSDYPQEVLLHVLLL